eukprot:SAG31_NODE_1_length_62978_cov_30.836130_13_plen_199_part_00
MKFVKDEFVEEAEFVLRNVRLANRACVGEFLHHRCAYTFIKRWSSLLWTWLTRKIHALPASARGSSRARLPLLAGVCYAAGDSYCSCRTGHLLRAPVLQPGCSRGCALMLLRQLTLESLESALRLGEEKNPSTPIGQWPHRVLRILVCVYRVFCFPGAALSTKRWFQPSRSRTTALENSICHSEYEVKKSRHTANGRK